ncbi:MAG: hypothetical protein AAF447_12490 [Myxococcota bacterium]
MIDGRPSPRWVDVPGAHSAAVFVAGAERPVAGSLAPARPLGAGVARRFRPAFAFAPGLTYEVRTARCRASFAVPRLEAAAPRVMAVYPRSPSIPENVLRFYVTFSEPMADAASSVPIRLLREGGEDLSGVFFRPDEALWSADRRRLTLLVDPGRVKTGLRAHRTLGRAFVAGERYRLEVRAGWPSLAGKPLETPFVHRFVATPEDRAKVDPARWCVRTTEGAAGARLTVGFGEPVDHASVQRLLRVANADDVLVPGSWTLGAGDAQARWTPAEPLGAAFGSHRLLVGARFEDVAGNDLRAAFDHGVGAGRHAPELVTRSLRAAGVAGGAEPCDESLHEPRR